MDYSAKIRSATDRYIATLSRVLSEGDDEERLAAIKEITRIDSCLTSELLQAALDDPLPEVRSYAASAMGDAGPHAVERLIRALRDNSTHVRVSAIHALQQIGDTRSAESLVQIVTGYPSPRVRAEALEALATIDRRVAYPYAVRVVQDPDPYVRGEAMAVLGIYTDQHTLDLLNRSLADHDPAVRAYAAQALGHREDLTDATSLIEALKDEHATVRFCAAYSLAVKNASDAVIPFIRALDDEDERVRGTAIAALGSSGDARAIEPLAMRLSCESEPMKSEIMLALAKLRGRDEVERLAALLESNSPQERLNVACALWVLEDERAIDPLIDLLDYEGVVCRPSILNLLVWRKPGKAVDALIAILAGKCSAVSKADAAWALGEIGDQKAIGPLLASLDRDERSLSLRAVEALGKLEAEEAVPPIVRILRSDPYHLLRRQAAFALGSIYSTEAIDLLITALDDEDASVRAEAANALL